MDIFTIYYLISTIGTIWLFTDYNTSFVEFLLALLFGWILFPILLFKRL